MAWTNYQMLLAGMMVVTGSINTLSTKWADKQTALSREFDHPFFQAAGMFLGEWSCMLVFHIMKWYSRRTGQPMELGPQKFNPIIFLPAAMCDMCATSTMYIGLTLTYASSFQMLRGAVIIFTALLSVAFLGRTIKYGMWVGMGLVLSGLAIIGVADILFGNSGVHNTNGIIAGDLLIILAQIIVATQMVYEERFINKHNVPPMQVVGWEGFFGFCVLSVLLLPMYFIDAGVFSKNPYHRLEDALFAFQQMGASSIILVATLGNIISIAFFNFSGISITKEMSATTRMVLDSLRTVVIWTVSLCVGWQTFQALQLLGFFLLLLGMCLYNNIIVMPLIRKYIVHRTQEEMEDTPAAQIGPNDERQQLLTPDDTAIHHEEEGPRYEPRREPVIS